MAKSGPHGTLLQVAPPEAGEAASPDAAKRDDEYADHVVQTFRVAPSSTLKAEKKIVIPSREAQTLKVRHEDVPALAAALARERARVAEAHASDGLPVQPQSKAHDAADDTSWIDDHDSFDPESFSSEHPPPMASGPSAAVPALAAPPRSRAGLLLALLGVVVVAGGAAVLVLNGQVELPFGLGDPGVTSEPPSVAAATAAPSTTAAPAASASSDAPTRETASPAEEPITDAAATASASASSSRPGPAPKRPAVQRDPQVYPDL